MRSLLVCLLIVAGLAGPAAAAPPDALHGKVKGYLAQGDLPDSVSLLAPPPAQGSAASAADEEAYRLTRSLRGTPRWALAARDADLVFPEAAEIFSCALDAPINDKETPCLYQLLLRAKADAARATGKAKGHYLRVRPFVVYKEATCTPDFEFRMAFSGSYPSAHAAVGWAWALILAEIAPERIDAVLARGREFGRSRVVCGVHWQSDVEAGCMVASGVVARLHADPAFRMQVEAARAELAGVRAKKLKPARDCKTEAAALALGGKTE